MINNVEPRGVGKTCLDCKRFIDGGYCDFTCWCVSPEYIIPKHGCLAYQTGFGNFESKGNYNDAN